MSIKISEKIENINNLYYIQNNLLYILDRSGVTLNLDRCGTRAVLNVNCDSSIESVIKNEICDKISDIIVVGYKSIYLNKNLKITGLNAEERGILNISLISADIEDDKKYVFEKIKNNIELTIDGIYNFRLKLLKNKWQDVISYIPTYFTNSQLRDFILYLIESKRKRAYIDNGKVYDYHFRRLTKTDLLQDKSLKLFKEILLSNCGEIALNSQIPKCDENYLKEFYGDKIYFTDKYF